MNYEETQITGVVEEVTFRNDANGFTVLDISVDNDDLTAVGVMPGVSAGESVTLTGTYTTHPSFGTHPKRRTTPPCRTQILLESCLQVLLVHRSNKLHTLVKKNSELNPEAWLFSLLPEAI